MGVSNTPPDVRDAVVNALVRTENGAKYSNLELSHTLEKFPFDDRDRALFTALYYGVTERKLSLDYVIGKLSARPVSGIEPRTLAILRMGLYQLIYMDRIPAHAAVSSAVNLTRKRGTDTFVNAILRSYLRQAERFLPENTGLAGAELLSYRYSLPVWMIRSWTADYGEARAESICAAFGDRPTMTLRVNTLRIRPEDLACSLAADGIAVTPSRYADGALCLDGACPVERIDAIRNGEAFVQDEASQICCEVLGAEPGEQVIDVCACPGGKTFSTAIRMRNEGRVRAYDLHASKLSLVRSGAERLGLSIVETDVGDGRERREELVASADRVLCDVPCSGLGVLAKKPDIREKTEESAERLPSLQYAILRNASAYVKPDGILVYSTCTLRRAENEDVVMRFLEEHGGFAPEEFVTKAGASARGCLTLFPDGGTDGFFMARMRRKAE